MPRKQKRRGKPRFHELRPAAWAGLTALAFVTGVVAGYLLRDLTAGPDPIDPLTAIEELLGPLDAPTLQARAADRAAAEALLDRLQAIARRAGPKVHVGSVLREQGAFRTVLEVGGTPHPVEIRWPQERALLAVVIDDMGGDLERARAFLDLEIPITPSILPHLSESKAVAQLARDRGREYLLHLPMQPQGYPEIDPGPGALLEEMDEADVRRLVSHNLAAVPGASGVNNHMGSRLSEMETPMMWVMEALKHRGLYFLDSLTSADSVAAFTASRAGLRWARRDVFLDNARNESAIGEQLQRAAEIAKDRGSAIAIGHTHPETLEALRAWVPRLRSNGVLVVPLGELLQAGDGV